MTNAPPADRTETEGDCDSFGGQLASSQLPHDLSSVGLFQYLAGKLYEQAHRTSPYSHDLMIGPRYLLHVKVITASKLCIQCRCQSLRFPDAFPAYCIELKLKKCLLL